MTTPVGLVIFDRDGVLVDSERIAVRINIARGAELGWPLTAVDGVNEVLNKSILPTCVASSGTYEKMRHTLGRTNRYPRFPVCQGELRPAVHSKSAGQGEFRIESVDYCC